MGHHKRFFLNGVVATPDGKEVCASDGKTVYVSSATDDTITVYDVATKRQVKVIQLEQGLAPKRMQVVCAPRSTTEN